jgi:hypothetical protein
MQTIINITFFEILIVGIVANIITDIYEFAIERYLGKARDWHLVGRWMITIPRSSIIIDPNDDTQATSGELPLGWIFHYVVGVLFAAIYLIVVFVLDTHPSFANAVGFGIITVVAPWFILMPALGAGMFASKAARPNFIRVMSLSVHVVFGIGIYFGTIVAGLA